MPTRQQRRTKARAPAKKKQKGHIAFLAVLVAIMLAGGAAASLIRVGQPKQATRGAIATEHWHASYLIELCGKQLPPFPANEGEIHTHGDGRMHVHPQTSDYELDNDNLGKFFDSVEWQLGRNSDGKNFLRTDQGQLYQDGMLCKKGGPQQKLIVTNNGKLVEGDPSKAIIHDGDDFVIRFGPSAASHNPLPTTAPEKG